MQHVRIDLKQQWQAVKFAPSTDAEALEGVASSSAQVVQGGSRDLA